MLAEKFADVQEEGAAKRKLKMSTSLKFCKQMAELMDVLNASSPYYIRCVRPNSHHSESEFDFALVQKQLKYFGVMETVRIRRLGYPERKAFVDFYKTYRILLSTYDATMPEPGTMPRDRATFDTSKTLYHYYRLNCVHLLLLVLVLLRSSLAHSHP